MLSSQTLCCSSSLTGFHSVILQSVVLLKTSFRLNETVRTQTKRISSPANVEDEDHDLQVVLMIKQTNMTFKHMKK